jgi:mannose-6-phosphate isomerase-like protein (cupin superfamily)
MNEKYRFRCFRPSEIAKKFPDDADTLLLDEYLTNEQEASAKLFRVYRGTPPHYHAHSDEYLYVLSGRGTFWMAEPKDKTEFGPGDLLFFKRTIIHALPDILEGPGGVLVDSAPRRQPKDIIFVNSEDGNPETFIRGL